LHSFVTLTFSITPALLFFTPRLLRAFFQRFFLTLIYAMHTINVAEDAAHPGFGRALITKPLTKLRAL
jgi:hypothetical protein